MIVAVAVLRRSRAPARPAGMTSSNPSRDPTRASVRALAFLLLLLGTIAAARAERLDLPALQADGGFRQVSFAELLGVPPNPGLEFTVEIPAAYDDRELLFDANDTIMWSRLGDFGRARRGKPISPGGGALITQRSRSVTFDRDSAQFRDEAGLTEANMGERLADHRATAIRVQRADRGPVPILLLEADLPNHDKLRAFYVLAADTSRVVFYLPQRPWNAADELVWSRLRDFILGSEPKHAAR